MAFEKMHFISGLPCSGSTLLSALLRHNPRFSTDITGPVSLLCVDVHRRIGGAGEYSVLFDDARCARMLRGIFSSYYAHVPAVNLVFDTNRTWTSQASLLDKLYPGRRIICCVRDIGWIIDSLERMRNKNPLKLSKLFGGKTDELSIPGSSLYMNHENGLVGAAWSGLREAWFSETARNLIVVPYYSLVRSPERVLKRLYQGIGEPYFEHDFKNVIYDAPEYDNNLGIHSLHTVRPIVEYRERQPVIPPDLFTKYAKTHFCANLDLNPRQVLIL